MAASLNGLGILAWSRGDLDRATEIWRRALEIRQQLSPDGAGSAATLNNLGLVAMDRGDLEGASDFYQRAFEIQEGLEPNSLAGAAALNNLGIVAKRRGDLAAASNYYEQALEIREQRAPESLDVAVSLTNLGNLASERGDLERTAEYLHKALAIEQRLAPDSLDTARTLTGLAHLSLERHDLERAADYFERALEILERQSPQGLEVAGTLEGLGLVAHHRGDLATAAQYYSRSLAIHGQLTPDSLSTAEGHGLLGSVALDQGELDLAREHFTRALAIQQELAPDGLDAAHSLSNLGLIALARGELAAADDYQRQALAIVDALVPGSRMQAEMLHALAKIRRQRQPEAALPIFLRAIDNLEDIVGRLGGSRYVQAGFRAQYRSHYRDAIDLLLEQERKADAFDLLERSRAQSVLAQLAERDLLFSDLPQALDRRRRSLNTAYNNVQRQLLALSPSRDREQIAQLQRELRRLQEERDEIQAAIRRDHPRRHGLLYPEPLDTEAARRSLDRGTLMLSFSVGEETSYLFALSQDDGLDVYVLAAGEELLTRQVRQFRRLIEDRTPFDRAASRRRMGRWLFETLIEPAAERVKTSERLLVIPDGPLHELPFAALEPTAASETGVRMEYLVEWKPLHVALSATVLAQTRTEVESIGPDRRSGSPAGAALSTDPRAAPPVRLAAFGDAVYQDRINDKRGADLHGRAAVDCIRSLGRLPGTLREVEQIAELYDDRAQIYLREEATEERVKGLGSGIGILHLAVHGCLDNHVPLNSFLALTLPGESSKGGDNGLLQVWEIYESVRLDADLVVLSGCETSRGKELGAEGLVGLTGAFLHAGARSVLASLWSISDQETAELMVHFHRHLNAGLPEAEALRAAQLEMIRQPIEPGEGEERRLSDAADPYYWAAFQLYGDWR